MKEIHLTDELLQVYLTEKVADKGLVDHLESCSTCQKNLADYQQIIEASQTMKVETFSFDVAELAMHSITQFERKKSKLENWMFWGILFVLIIITTVLCLPFLPKVLAIFSSNSVWTTTFASATGILLFTVLLIDVIKQHKSKEQKLLNQQVQPIR